jgi:hypothetical protein
MIDIQPKTLTLLRVDGVCATSGSVMLSAVHRSRADSRNEYESCGNARFRERKCSLLSNVKIFAPQRKILSLL